MPEVESIEKSIARHERGEVKPDSLYVRLYCSIYGLNEQQVAGALVPTVAAANCEITSHKFVMAHVPPSSVGVLAAMGEPSAGAWFECQRTPVETPFGMADLFVWPFGVVSCHLVESGEWACISDLAQWRVGTYCENLDWFSSWLTSRLRTDVEAAYVLSVYWVGSSMWAGDDLTTAVHLLSSPKTLLGREPQGSDAERAESRLVERSLFKEGFRHAGVREFGIAGISVGAASWSGVAYSPVAKDRALTETDLVECELAIQALWTYCDYVSRSREEGQALDIDPEYSRSFLRRARSRLNMSRPQETGQHMSMRTAIVETSGVSSMLGNAIDLMREG
jgi:hypothetical protein